MKQSVLLTLKKEPNMERSFMRLTAAGIISLFIASCAAAPAPQEEAPPPAARPAPTAPAPTPVPPPQDPDLGPPTQEALGQLNAAKSRAETSRQQAVDIESPSYSPPEWQSAEDQYASIKEQEKESTLGEVKQAISLYNAAADAYDDASRKALPFFFQDLADRAAEAREEAVEAGVESLSPDRLAAADGYANRARSTYEEGEPASNYYAAAEYGFGALSRYQAIRPGTLAYFIREEILERDFVKYDPDNCALAEASLFEAVSAYDTGDTALAQDSADEAFLRYNLALKTGWESYAGEQRANALQERQAALTAKANVAVKNDYGAADGIFVRGDNALRTDKLPEAADLFKQSVPLFVTARRLAEEKRRIAEQAIDTAEKRAQISDDTAREAEGILGRGGAQ
jgi:hypothetical protein